MKFNSIFNNKIFYNKNYNIFKISIWNYFNLYLYYQININ